MLKKSLNYLCATLLLGLFTQSTWANLLINPTRVEFNPSDRTADVTLINTSKFTTTYRLGWIEKKAKVNGGYKNLTATEAANFPIASSMLRFSPKQVTLKAGERQTVKMAIRRPQNLATGEYRSHLQLKALPPKTAEEGLNPNASVTSINMVVSFAIPVVIQQGVLDYQITMNTAHINYNPTTKDGSVAVNLARTGVHSVMGNMNAYWTPNGGKERLIAKVGDYNLWPELSTTTVSLSWVGADFAVTDGKLRIVYEGVKSFRGKTFAEKTITVKGSMIKTAN
jgi:P pilus assembly chaperone PapD